MLLLSRGPSASSPPSAPGSPSARRRLRSRTIALTSHDASPPSSPRSAAASATARASAAFSSALHGPKLCAASPRGTNHRRQHGRSRALAGARPHGAKAASSSASAGGGSGCGGGDAAAPACSASLCASATRGPSCPSATERPQRGACFAKPFSNERSSFSSLSSAPPEAATAEAASLRHRRRKRSSVIDGLLRLSSTERKIAAHPPGGRILKHRYRTQRCGQFSTEQYGNPTKITIRLTLHCLREMGKFGYPKIPPAAGDSPSHVPAASRTPRTAHGTNKRLASRSNET